MKAEPEEATQAAPIETPQLPQLPQLPIEMYVAEEEQPITPADKSAIKSESGKMTGLKDIDSKPNLNFIYYQI